MEDDSNSMFKCNFENCPYGFSGKKYFKKRIFLRNHVQNVHREKQFKCHNCEKKFAFDWQLKYHFKYCGVEIECATCHKVYNNRSALDMHCRRNSHEFPGLGFRKSKPKTNCNNFIFVPIFINNVVEQMDSVFVPSVVPTPSDTPLNLNVKSKHILPKVTTETTDGNYLNKKSISTETEQRLLMKNTKLKRSAECQTVRKRNRHLDKNESKSIETQTLHSSFDPNDKNNNIVNQINSKCSSFTQTFMDDIEMSDSIIVKDTFLSFKPHEIANLEQSVQTEFDCSDSWNVLDNYNTTETQTNITTDDIDPEMSSISSIERNDFKLSDLEFIDIETQTIWNYDRTTQTDNDMTLENLILNL